MATGRIPRAYINDVPKDGDTDPTIHTVPFAHLGIGARPSILKETYHNGIDSLDHVGGSAGKGNNSGRNR
jgi:hypothetical protein